MRKFSQTIRVAVLLFTLAALSITACDREHPPVRIGSPAPEFTLTDGAQSVNLSRLRGHTVVLNLWATWCVPCVQELPSLIALQRRQPQLIILAISQDDDSSAYRQFLTDNHVDLLTLRDPTARIPHLYGTVKIPETYIIDRNGLLRRKFVNAQNWTSPQILDYLAKL